jgi:membrane protein YqaA with SNARE-associated domain
VPLLWGAPVLSLSSVAGNTIGGALGVWAGYKLARRLDL